ncbi:hypothetical protein [Blautia sp. MSJ-9]|uniref:hypothetical protein n=1 Tax=Blautia sp. MSJ-9 TaxID=2841511 RepID=UPI001C12046A|nr:hypothetical protein [Blautia sp. MSJ-9]MBU5680647.1 hypothetical protein [Blautia sp. MSJ-9]
MRIKFLIHGLSIWKREEYRKLQGTYPVIYMSFANIRGRGTNTARHRSSSQKTDTGQTIYQRTGNKRNKAGENTVLWICVSGEKCINWMKEEAFKNSLLYRN